MEAILEIRPVRPLLGKVVLIVEDQYLIALEAQAMVEEAGAARVLLASSTEEADHVLAAYRVDVAVLDFFLTEGTTGPLMARLRERDIPFVVASGYDASEEETVTAPLVRKPYLADDLIPAIALAIGGA